MPQNFFYYSPLHSYYSKLHIHLSSGRFRFFFSSQQSNLQFVDMCFQINPVVLTKMPGQTTGTKSTKVIRCVDVCNFLQQSIIAMLIRCLYCLVSTSDLYSHKIIQT